MKIYKRSSGSLIGVLKRTIESAPTRPRESAREPLTTVMIKHTHIDKGTRVEINWRPPEELLEA